MDELWEIGPAERTERLQALQLICQHLERAERDVRLDNTLRLITIGAVDPAGLLVARQPGAPRTPGQLLAAVLCAPLCGAGGLMGVPQVTTGEDPVWAERLAAAGTRWLMDRGAKVVQCFVAANERPFMEPLIEQGFQKVTQLLYLRHELHSEAASGFLPPGIQFQEYGPENATVFHETMLKTYENTLDGPELNGLRTMEEVLDGLRNQGTYRPELWWLATVRKQPAGVIVVADLPEEQSWDLAYVGVVSAYRRQGVARAMLERVLRRAIQAQMRQLISAVDARNQPARQLYAKLAFCEGEQRDVYLFFPANLVKKKGADCNDTST